MSSSAGHGRRHQVISVLLATCLLFTTAAQAEGGALAGQPPPRVEYGSLATDDYAPGEIASANRAMPAAGDALCAGRSKRHLCVTRQHMETNAWRFGGADRHEQNLAADDAGETVADFELDRSWHYLALVTAAEGHPFLAVYDFDSWQHSGKRPGPLLSVNPYPGSLALVSWDNNLPGKPAARRCIYFSSDGPVKGEAGDFPLPEMRQFRACLPGWKIEPL